MAVKHSLQILMPIAPTLRVGASAGEQANGSANFPGLKRTLGECALRNLAHPAHPWHGERPRVHPMSWQELERFVADVEGDQALQRALKHCRSRKELILAGRRLGYRITRMDLQRAWQEEQLEQAQRDQAAR